MDKLNRYAALVAFVAVVAVAVSLAPVGARGPLPRLADYGLIFGDNATSLWGGEHAGDQPDGGTDPPTLGSWSVTDVRYANKSLDMRVRVEPPAWSLPVEAGPAVLFTTLSLMGGVGGDVGYQRVISVGSTQLPACSSDPCVFQSDVHVPLDRVAMVARSAHRTEGFGSPSAAIGFTLVRTFAGGTWLQFLEGYDRNGDALVHRSLKESGMWAGRAEPMGLYPSSMTDGPRDEPGLRHFDYGVVVEQARQAMGDITRPVPSTPVRFIAGFTGCSGPVAASLQTVAGDRAIIDAAGSPPRVDATVDLPTGTTWRVGYDPRGATFEAGSNDLVIVARYRCAEANGVRLSDVAIAEIVSSSVAPQATPGTSGPLILPLTDIPR